jgi:hypothetical protein
MRSLNWLKNDTLNTSLGVRFKKYITYFFELNPSVLIVYGSIVSGKSKRAQQIEDRAKVNGYKASMQYLGINGET